MTKPLRVLQVLKGLGRGGAEVLMAEVLKASDPAAHTLGFAHYLSESDTLAEPLRQLGADVFSLGARSNRGMAAGTLRLTKVIRRWKPDVIHAHLPLAGVGARLAGRLAGVPVVYTEHNIFDRYHPLTQLAARLSWRLQREVIACSGEVATALERLGSRVPVSVVRNGVAVDHYVRDAAAGQALRARLGVPDGAPILGTVAVFRTEKRLDRWVEVARRVSEARPDTRFLLVGFGPLRAEVEGWVRAAGLQERVVLPGPQTDVRPWMSAMDIYLMTSDFEGLPIALLEAMAMGTPIVSTAVGGIAEAMEHPTEAWLTERPEDVQHLVDGVLGLLADPERRARVAVAARARVERQFGIQTTYRALAEVWERGART